MVIGLLADDSDKSCHGSSKRSTSQERPKPSSDANRLHLHIVVRVVRLLLLLLLLLLGWLRMVEMMLYDREATLPCSLARLFDSFHAAASVVNLM